jgi:hypothetical protein
MKPTIVAIALLGVAAVLPTHAGMKRETNTVTEENVHQVQGELDRDFGQLLGLLNQADQEKMKANQQEWQKGLAEKISANPNQVLTITFQETGARVCVLESIIEQMKTKESSK